MKKCSLCYEGQFHFTVPASFSKADVHMQGDLLIFDGDAGLQRIVRVDYCPWCGRRIEKRGNGR